jgi:hypothetical protein
MRSLGFGSENLSPFRLPLSTCHFLQLLCLLMNGMLPTESAILFELQLIWSGSLILSRRIVPPLTLCTGQS